MIFESVAFAMGGGAQQSGGQVPGNPLVGFAPLIIMFVVFYFVLIRPQYKKSKQHKDMLGALKKGDHVLTSGGLCGRITAVDGERISVELADNLVVQVHRSYVVGLSDDQPARKDKDKEKDKEEKK